MDDVNTFECINIMNETDIEYKIKNKEDCRVNMEIRNMLKDKALFLRLLSKELISFWKHLK